MARDYFNIQKKTILGRDHRFFSAVLKEMGVVIINIDTRVAQGFV